MEKIVLYVFFTTLFIHPGNAQSVKTDSVYYVKSDTINIKGVIYGYDDKPVSDVRIGLLSVGFHPPAYPLITKTNTNGEFELKGANPADRLMIMDGRYVHQAFETKGSRFMVIYLPPPKIIDLNIGGPIEVSAVSKHKKVIPAFRVRDTGDRIFDGDIGDVLYPRINLGHANFLKYIKQHLFYPEAAIRNNIEGTVEIGFVIDKDNSIKDIKVLKGIGYGCDEQVIKLIKDAGKWRPGIFAGEYFPVQQTVSVKFSLTDK